MDWSDIGETVANAAPILGGALGGPAGGAAGTLIAQMFGSDTDPKAVSQAIQQDADATIKLQKLEQEHKQELTRMYLESETNRLTEINKTMRAEYKTDDAYRGRWRPTFGYAAALTWVLQVVGVVYSIIFNPQHAAEVINAITALTPMWGIALAVLGVNISKRSRDKQVDAGQEPPKTLLESITEKLSK